ncbi:Predicted arabinose efflux permease, MFS family [Actinokineospora alba]|uniref:Predicted arabinose efflux permease, MFS family n=1 Tax=Actinokineospora alba TaxID=504798 RepID=A0A1H0W389_9PSEU|nr:MFS transporter [Actinokineospora alba]TDP67791.1 putative MFS family arabinose efflux permease [Actinokineospora alba]SDI71934.1 Predicted arabinose efflux permease, MFS family [Actinokineospora alba]SDP84806.1 Predicted arabinose efflux permease, MFS family [Actinokineospora alba]
MTVGPARPRFGQVFAIGEFRMLWLAQLVAVGGNQLAKVALAVLVFERSASAGLAALTYALTLLPELIGGPLLSWLADRYPRRGLMVVCDLARAGLVAAMAVPDTPLWVLGALLILVQLLQSPHMAARAALLATMVRGEAYLAAAAVVNVTAQLGQLAGFAAGGLAVALLGPSAALLVNAGTFVLSALLTQFGLVKRARPAGAPPGASRWSAVTGGAGMVRADRRLLLLLAFGCVSGFYACKEGLAAPYAEALGHGPSGVGLLLAASPAGAVVGVFLLTRFVSPDRGLRLLGPLAVASCAVLVFTVVSPGIAVTCALFALSGLFSAYQVPANAAYSLAVPDAMRGQAFGVASAAVRVAQGVGISAAGFAADLIPAQVVIAVFALIGAGASVALAVAWSRLSQERAGAEPAPVPAG